MTIYPVVIRDWRIIALIIAVCVIGYVGSSLKDRHDARKMNRAFRRAYNNDRFY